MLRISDGQISGSSRSLAASLPFHSDNTPKHAPTPTTLARSHPASKCVDARHSSYLAVLAAAASRIPSCSCTCTRCNCPSPRRPPSIPNGHLLVLSGPQPTAIGQPGGFQLPFCVPRVLCTPCEIIGYADHILPCAAFRQLAPPRRPLPTSLWQHKHPGLPRWPPA
jgi:hypothetical protein